MLRASTLALVLALLALLAPSPARAHGGRPQTYDALFGASDDDIVVPATFGVMTTIDGGAHWDWVCIEGMPDAVRGVLRPTARTPSDTILFAENFGLLDGRARACDPSFDATLHDRFVSDVTTIPGGGFAAVTSDADAANHLHVSSDGETFAPIGDPFPTGFLAERVRYAPSDATRVYVSGETRVTGSAAYTGSLLVSSDGGMHWSVIAVPLVGDESVLRVLAVDPASADRFFAVAQASSTDRLIEGTMAGAMRADALTMPAVPIAVNRPFALGFASDGAVWFGNTMAGLFRILPGDTPRPVDRHLHVACVVPHGDDLYLCGDGLLDAFALGVQHAGPDYAPIALMQFAQLTTQRSCGTSLDGVCAGWWDDLLRDTGRPELVPDAGPPDASTFVDAAATDASTPAMDAGAATTTPSCACRSAARHGPPPVSLVLLALLTGVALRRSRSACRPSS